MGSPGSGLVGLGKGDPGPGLSAALRVQAGPHGQVERAEGRMGNGDKRAVRPWRGCGWTAVRLTGDCCDYPNQQRTLNKLPTEL